MHCWFVRISLLVLTHQLLHRVALTCSFSNLGCENCLHKGKPDDLLFALLKCTLLQSLDRGKETNKACSCAVFCLASLALFTALQPLFTARPELVQQHHCCLALRWRPCQLDVPPSRRHPRRQSYATAPAVCYLTGILRSTWLRLLNPGRAFLAVSSSSKSAMQTTPCLLKVRPCPGMWSTSLYGYQQEKFLCTSTVQKNYFLASGR